MRKLTYLAAALVALAATSVAVAHGIGGAKTSKAVVGTFTATSASTSTTSCTTSDGKALVVTEGRYTGVAAGDPDLAGPITIRARSVINTTDGVGVVDGALRIGVASGRDTFANYAAVYDHGNISGLAVGRAHDPSARLVANLSAAYSAAGGFTGGKLGGGTAGGSAVEVGPGTCAPTRPKSEKTEARGTVSAVSASSITVAGLTCALPSAMSADVNAKLKVGDRAELRCALVGGAPTVVRVEKKH